MLVPTYLTVVLVVLFGHRLGRRSFLPSFLLYSCVDRAYRILEALAAFPGVGHAAFRAFRALR